MGKVIELRIYLEKEELISLERVIEDILAGKEVVSPNPISLVERVESLTSLLEEIRGGK